MLVFSILMLAFFNVLMHLQSNLLLIRANFFSKIINICLRTQEGMFFLLSYIDVVLHNFSFHSMEEMRHFYSSDGNHT